MSLVVSIANEAEVDQTGTDLRAVLQLEATIAPERAQNEVDAVERDLTNITKRSHHAVGAERTQALLHVGAPLEVVVTVELMVAWHEQRAMKALGHCLDEERQLDLVGRDVASQHQHRFGVALVSRHEGRCQPLRRLADVGFEVKV